MEYVCVAGSKSTRLVSELFFAYDGLYVSCSILLAVMGSVYTNLDETENPSDERCERWLTVSFAVGNALSYLASE
jgi:hypothetical protein